MVSRPKELKQDGDRTPRLNREAWVEAAMGALASDGVDGLRVEAVAKRLKVTKGGFYWHFRDRADLVRAVLESWRDGRLQAVASHTSLQGEAPEQTLRALIGRYTANRNRKGAAIELALRDWARRDEVAARVVAEVDDFRLERVARLFRAMGYAPDVAFGRAYLFYSYLFGQSLLVGGIADPSHGQAQQVCAEVLIGARPGGD